MMQSSIQLGPQRNSKYVVFYFFQFDSILYFQLALPRHRVTNSSSYLFHASHGFQRQYEKFYNPRFGFKSHANSRISSKQANQVFQGPTSQHPTCTLRLVYGYIVAKFYKISNLPNLFLQYNSKLLLMIFTVSMDLKGL